MIREVFFATALSWVIMITVIPLSESSLKISIISSPVFVSKAPVGSSASIIFGSPTKALAIETLCCSPPDSSPGE